MRSRSASSSSRSRSILLTGWRGLTKVARETKSDALEADALRIIRAISSPHFSFSPVWRRPRFGFPHADALAAIGVAIFIALSCFRLGRHTIDALVDTAPKGLADSVAKAIRAVPGVAAIDAIRLRPSGMARFSAKSAYSFRERCRSSAVAAIKDDVIRRIGAEWPEAALTVTANPRALDDESLLERVQLIATRLRLAVHHITIQEVDARKCVSLDMEVDGRMGLGDAHELATRLGDGDSKTKSVPILRSRHIYRTHGDQGNSRVRGRSGADSEKSPRRCPKNAAERAACFEISTPCACATSPAAISSISIVGSTR